MEAQIIQQHINLWLKENPNPYISTIRSWEEYCNENEIPTENTIGILLATLQVFEIKFKKLKEAVEGLQNMK